MLGERLKYLRKTRKLEAKSIAKDLNVAKSTYSGYENNKSMPSYDILNKLADLFNVSTDYLLGRTDDMNNVNNDESLDKEMYQLASAIIEIYINKGKIKIGEKLTKEQRKKFLREIEAFIDMTNKLEDN